MSRRYQVDQGIVIRRTVLPNGDVVATVLSERGKWRGIARKGKKLGGNVGRLSLFHDVTVQHYRRNPDDLALVTQVELNGALPALADPAIYPYAHLLAELADRLTVDVHVGERIYAYLASGLRGLSRHPDPEAIALAYAWRLLEQAGLGPEMGSCVHCGATSDAAESGPVRFDVDAGGIACASCAMGMPLAPAEAAALVALVRAPLREAIAVPFAERTTLWRILARYVAFHVAILASLQLLPTAALALEHRA